MTDDERLSEPEAADELGVELNALRRWRDQGDAPPHHVDHSSGETYYLRRELVEWREKYVYPPGEIDAESDEGAEA